MNVCCVAGGHHHPLIEHVSVFLHSWCGHATLPPLCPLQLPSGPSEHFFAKWPKQALCPLQLPSAQKHDTVYYGYTTGILFLLHASVFLSGIQASVFLQASRPPFSFRRPGLRLFCQASRHQASFLFPCIQASPFQGWGD